jgi:hypothetical protein
MVVVLKACVELPERRFLTGRLREPQLKPGLLSIFPVAGDYRVNGQRTRFCRAPPAGGDG